MNETARKFMNLLHCAHLAYRMTYVAYGRAAKEENTSDMRRLSTELDHWRGAISRFSIMVRVNNGRPA